MEPAEFTPTEDQHTGVSFEPVDISEEENNAPVSLPAPTGPTSVMPSTQLADRKTNKVNYALGQTMGKGASEIYTDMINGREQALRDQAAADVSAKAAKIRSQKMLELAQKAGPLDPLQARAIYAPTEEVNPSTVFEKAYATKYLSSIDDSAKSMQDTVLDTAKSEIPQQVEQIKDKANTLLSKIEIIRNLQDDVEDDLKQQGWVPFLADQAKLLFQPYPEIKLRGQNPDVGKVSGGLLLGTNVEAQADALFSLPTDEFKDRLVSIVNELKEDNPSLAKQFLDYVSGASANQKAIDNVFSLALPADAQIVAQGGARLLRGASVMRRANKAFKDMVQSAAHADKDMPISAAAAEGAGDANTAAAIRLQTNLEKSAKGSLDPDTSVKEALTSNFRLDADTLASNPGSLSREKLTRLQESMVNSGDNLAETLTSTLRPNRTPNALQDPVALETYNAKLREQFRGVDNQILDFSPPRQESASNAYLVDVHIGSNDGALFSSPEVARNNAELNSFKNVRIVEAEGSVEVEPSQLAGPKRHLIRRAQLEGPEGSLARHEKFTKDLRIKLKDKKLDKEAKKSLREDYKTALEILDRYKKQLELAKAKTYMTDAVIEQKGLGYKYVVTKPYRETDDVVRAYQIKRGDGSYNPASLSTASMTGWHSWKNAALGWFRGADDGLALNDAIQRKVTTYAQNRFRQWAKEEAAKIEEIASGAYRTDPITGNRIPWYQSKARSLFNNVTLKQNKVFEEFKRTLDYARKAIDPETGLKGYFFRTPGEIEAFYMNNFQRMPSFPEIEAYFAHVKLTEADRIFREMSEYRNRIREGAEQHQLFFLSDKQKVGSGYFDGVQKTTWPSGNGQVLVMGRNKGDERLAYVSNQKGGFNSAELERYKEGVKEGRYKIIEIYRPMDYPLRDFSDIAGNNYVRYVITDNYESKPLEFNHVNRRGGGHFEYDYDNYIKQAQVIPQGVSQSANDLRKIVSNLYVGDTTLMPISSRALGKEMVDKLNAARELIKEERWAEAKALAERTLPIEWKEFSSWFKPSRTSKGKQVPARLSAEEPFVVVPRDKKIYDLDDSLQNRHSHFQDGTKSGSLAARNQVAYNVERAEDEIHTVNRIADGQGQPLFNYEPAEMIDPITTMNRSLNRAINSVFMEDYKFYAVEHWLREAAPHLLATEGEIKASPFFHFENFNEKMVKSGTDFATTRNLMLNRMKIKQFVGMNNTFDNMIHSLTQHLVDAAYEGGLKSEKLAVVPLWMLNRIKNPVQLVRSYAFNAKLGLFNPAQVLVQAQTYANIIALEPRRGAASLYAATLHQMSRYNADPAILDHLDKMATKFNMFGVRWKPGEWKEAREALNKTGFEHVAGEHQYTDNQLHSKFIRNRFGNFLNAGQIFFREGEKSTRLGAWYTSYKRWRDANPVGKVTDKDLGEILNYADLLTNNMSRASASNLHSGVFGMTSQFLSYQLHLFELMFGKRLGATVAERNYARFRMFTTYSLLYGIPASSGLIGYPFGDAIREEALSRGYVVGDSWLKSMAMEGLPAFGAFLATGNAYNVGPRYGSQGLTFVQDALRSDNTIWKLLGGAGLSSLGNTFDALGGLTQSSLSWMWANNKDLQNMSAEHVFEVNDIIDVFKEVSSFNQAWKLIYALNTGRWMSKNEGYIKDVGALDAIFMSVTGLSPQGQDDMYHMQNVMKTEKEAQEYAYKQFSKEFHRGLQASKDGNQTQSNEYMRRAFWHLEWSGYPLDMKAQAIARASKGYESMMAQTEANFATRHIPQHKPGLFGTQLNLPFLGQSNVPETRLKQYETRTQQQRQQ